MKQKSYKQKSYYMLSVFIVLADLILISFVTVILFKIIPFEKSDIVLNYDSLLGTFIAICTTFVVGFQIFNYIYYANKMDALDKEMDALNKEKENLRLKIKDLEFISVKSMYFNAYTIGRSRFQMAEGYHYKIDDKKYYWNALRGLSNALKYAANGGHDFNETYQSISQKIYSSIDLIIEDVNHLVYNSAPDWIKEIEYEVDASLEEIKNYIEADNKRKAKYHKIIDYYFKWHEFVG